MTIRFLKPRKLGAALESWLKHEVLGMECTAAMCRYFFFVRGRTGSRGWIVDKPLRLTCEWADRLMGASAGLSLAVAVAESTVSAMVST